MPKKEDAAKAAAKKAAKAARVEAKTKRSATKAARKAGALDSDEEDIDALLVKLRAEDAKRTAVTVEPLPAPPSPRVNFSLVALPGGGAHGAQELVLFGGEFFDGATNACYNDLLRLTVGPAAGAGGAPALAWRRVESPNAPGHRCSHQAVLVDGGRGMLLFGGEFATANQFYHWGDTWRLDVPTNRWELLATKRAPSARSGHRMAAWRNYAVLFGGFYQTLTREAWHGDLWLYDARAGGGGWSEPALPATAARPAPRSGAALVAVPASDTVVLYGGYSATRAATAAGGKGGGGAGGKTKSVVHTDLWVLKLAPVLTGGAPVWERVRTTGAPPPPRLGFSMVPFKDKLLLFGGVVDADVRVAAAGAATAAPPAGAAAAAAAATAGALGRDRDDAAAVFFSDLFSFDPARRRWYKLALREPATAARAGGAAARRERKAAAAASASAAGAAADALLIGGDDDEEDEEEEAALRGSSRGRGARGEQRGGAGGAAGSSNGGGGEEDDIDDRAFYVYDNGKLVRLEIEDDEAEEEGEAAAGGEGGEGGEGGAGDAGGERGEGGAGGKGNTDDSAVGAAAVTATLSGLALSSSAPAAADAAGAAGGAPPATLAAAAAPAGGSTTSAPASAPPRPSPVADAIAGPPPPPAPLGRLRAGLWADGHHVYVLGGLHETGATPGPPPGAPPGARALAADAEVTLDDVWRLDLRTRERWECLDAGRWASQAWRGEDSSDGEGDEDGGGGGDDDDDDESEGEGSDEEGDAGGAGGRAGGAGRGGGGGASGAAGAGAGRFGRSQLAASPEALAARELRDRLALFDAATTPAPGERLAAFFLRSSGEWVRRLLATPGAIAPGARVAGKELRRRAFALARARYDELWPLLVELHELETAQRELEEEMEAAAAAARARARGGGGGGGGGGGSGRKAGRGA